MELPAYRFRTDEELSTYFFESIGQRGIINKAVEFSSVLGTQYFNLSMGDLNPITGKISYSSITDNGDTVKILATVYGIVRDYAKYYPEHYILFSGNSPARNRLYRIAINHGLSEISREFSIFGFNIKNDAWELFRPSTFYEQFLVIHR